MWYDESPAMIRKPSHDEIFVTLEEDKPGSNEQSVWVRIGEPGRLRLTQHLLLDRRFVGCENGQHYICVARDEGVADESRPCGAPEHPVA